MAVHKDYFSFSLHVLIKTYYELLYKTIKRLFEVADGLIRLTMLHSLIDTMLNMLFQDCFAHLIKRCTNGCNLRQHVITVSSFFPEAFETISMTSDTCKPFSYVIACRIVWYMCQCKTNSLITSTFPPRGIYHPYRI